MLRFRALSRRLLFHAAALLRGSPVALLISFSFGATAAPGDLDLSFGGGVGFVTTPIGDSSVLSARAAISSDGKFVLVGDCYSGSALVFCVARFNWDGSLDTGFGMAGKVTTSVGGARDLARAVVIQPDAGIVVAGHCANIANPSQNYYCMVRYRADGTLDAAFGANGKVFTLLGVGTSSSVRGVAIQPDGKVVLAGSCRDGALYDICAARYDSQGQLDASFGVDGKVLTGISGRDFGFSLAIQPDGKILVAGACAATRFDFCVARYLGNGALDVSFGASGKVVLDVGGDEDTAYGIAVQSTGRIVVAGTCANGTGSYTSDDDFCLVRLNPDGTLDLSFGVSGKVITVVAESDDIGISVALQVDDKVVVAGHCFNGRVDDFCLVRYDSNGSIDATFAGGRVVTPIGTYASAYGVTVQGDGKILVSGTCTVLGTSKFCVARYEGGPFPSATCQLNVDANLVARPATDALLILRYLLGYRGTALTNGALGSNPTRTGQALETYLASLNLDADGDGQVNAMTDGLLILRAMLGLSGNALTAGAVNTSHPSARNAQQILTWIESTHGVACLP